MLVTSRASTTVVIALTIFLPTEVESLGSASYPSRPWHFGKTRLPVSAGDPDSSDH
jgi:hypothetical protein